MPACISWTTHWFDTKQYFCVKNHSVCRTQQGRQREPSVKTLRSSLFAEFWRHCVLSGGTQRRACASTPERINENINKYFISTSGDRTHNQSRLQSHFVPLRHDWRHKIYIFNKKFDANKAWYIKIYYLLHSLFLV